MWRNVENFPFLFGWFVQSCIKPELWKLFRSFSMSVTSDDGAMAYKWTDINSPSFFLSFDRDSPLDAINIQPRFRKRSSDCIKCTMNWALDICLKSLTWSQKRGRVGLVCWRDMNTTCVFKCCSAQSIKGHTECSWVNLSHVLKRQMRYVYSQQLISESRSEINSPDCSPDGIQSFSESKIVESNEQIDQEIMMWQEQSSGNHKNELLLSSVSRNKHSLQCDIIVHHPFRHDFDRLRLGLISINESVLAKDNHIIASAYVGFR
jgi:hypothetical protein